jgi:hypothetical protein
MMNFVDPIVLGRRFGVWGYGVGHSQLLLHARAGAADFDYLNVVFEDVSGVKLRSSYQQLILVPTGNPVRKDILAFADVPERHQHRYLSLTLSTLVVADGPRRPFRCGGQALET